MIRTLRLILCILILANITFSPNFLAFAQSTQNAVTKGADNAFNIDKWNHPTKNVLQKYNIKIIKVELLKNNTYPIFYIVFSKQLTQENNEYFKKLINEMAKANGYWSYQLRDEKNSIVIEVECEQKTKKVINISVNGNKTHFNQLTGDKLEIRQISRKDAGLSTIGTVNFEKFKIDSRIKGLLDGSLKYENKDYKNGIVDDMGYLLCERFKGNIIEHIKIGSNMELVSKVLGKPSFIKQDFIFYKSKNFYFGIKGKSKVEYAIFIKNRQIDYDKSILKLIIEKLSISGNGLYNTVTDNKS